MMLLITALVLCLHMCSITGKVTVSVKQCRYNEGSIVAHCVCQYGSEIFKLDPASGAKHFIMTGKCLCYAVYDEDVFKETPLVLCEDNKIPCHDGHCALKVNHTDDYTCYIKERTTTSGTSTTQMTTPVTSRTTTSAISTGTDRSTTIESTTIEESFESTEKGLIIWGTMFTLTTILFVLWHLYKTCIRSRLPNRAYIPVPGEDSMNIQMTTFPNPYYTPSPSVSHETPFASPLQSDQEHASPLQSDQEHAFPLQSDQEHASPLQSDQEHASPLESDQEHASSLQQDKEHASPLQSDLSDTEPIAMRTRSQTKRKLTF